MTSSNFNAGICGRQNLQVLKDGKVVRETGFHKNMILDSWFAMMVAGGGGPSSSNQAVSVGTGSTAVSPSQTTLASFLASRGGADSSVLVDLGIVSGNSVKKFVRTWTFLEGAVVGNVSEVMTYTNYANWGAGGAAAGTPGHSRSLVLDAFSVPTSIPVGAGEQLRIVHETELRIDLAGFSGSFDMTTGGFTTTHTCAVKVCNIGTINHILSMFFGRAFGTTFGADYNLNNYQTALTFGVNNGAPTMTAPVTTGQAAIVVSLVTPTSIKLAYTIASTQGNLAGGIGGVSLGGADTAAHFAVKFSPALPKTNLNKINLAIQFNFTRI